LELLKAETAERRLRSIRYRLGQARFPMAKDLDSVASHIKLIEGGIFLSRCFV